MNRLPRNRLPSQPDAIIVTMLAPAYGEYETHTFENVHLQVFVPFQDEDDEGQTFDRRSSYGDRRA